MTAENLPVVSTPPSATGPAQASQPIPTEACADFDKRLEFLYKIHDDSQNLIRFLDAKAAFAIAILAAMVNKILSNVGLYFPWGVEPHWRQMLVLGFGLTALVASALVVLILFPITNPGRNTRLISSTDRPSFFLTQLDPKRWLRIFSRSARFSRLAQDHSGYLSQVSTLTNAALLEIVSGEVLKVSYIRQIKTDRLRAVTIALACCAVFFVLLIATDTLFPQPSKPTLVQIQGPLTMNPPPANTVIPNTNSSGNPTSSGPTPSASGSAGATKLTSDPNATPTGVAKPK